jgi:hypothetical protein
MSELPLLASTNFAYDFFAKNVVNLCQLPLAFLLLRLVAVSERLNLALAELVQA